MSLLENSFGLAHAPQLFSARSLFPALEGRGFSGADGPGQHRAFLSCAGGEGPRTLVE